MCRLGPRAYCLAPRQPYSSAHNDSFSAHPIPFLDASRDSKSRTGLHALLIVNDKMNGVG